MKKKRGSNLYATVKTAAALAVVLAFAFLCAETCLGAEKKPALVAHGGGFIKGYETTNSVEAVMQSIADGFELIELDMSFSADGRLVMIHDWDRTAMKYFGMNFDGRMTEAEFEKILVNEQFHTLTLKRLIEILDEAPHVRIITDIKDDNIKALSEIAERYPGYIGRFIPQIYSYKEYGSVMRLGFSDVILTLYAMEKPDYDELLGFIRSRDLYAVTVGNEHEYTIKDLKYKLAADGVCVYFHPVSDFETAVSAMENGVHGLYVSALIPGDLKEPARSYYLLDEKVKLCDLDIGEKTFKALKNVKIKNGAPFDRTYLIGGEIVSDGYIEGLEDGAYELKLILSEGEKTVAELDYLLLAGAGLRILDKRFVYRLDEHKAISEMRDLLAGIEGVSEETIDLMQRSLMVKAGEYYGYFDGKPVVFLVGKEYLYTGKHANGSVISPFAECIMLLGAESVHMDDGKYVYVRYGGARVMMMANTLFISHNHKSSRLKTPLTIVRGKTMASGEIYRAITGREFIDDGEIMILLPENVKASEPGREEILRAAEALFEGKANLLQT